jgi:hypothetical protein
VNARKESIILGSFAKADLADSFARYLSQLGGATPESKDAAKDSRRRRLKQTRRNAMDTTLRNRRITLLAAA